MGPPSIAVCISSPVLSRNPVLINTRRSLACLIHSFKFIVVLLSSSIIPIFIVLFGNPSIFSTAANNSIVKATSSGPCIFGFTIYTEPVLELFFPFLRSNMDIMVVITVSIIPSGTSLFSE